MREIQDLLVFSIDNWYEGFKDVAIETEILPVPQALLQELASGNCSIDAEEVCSETYINELKDALKKFSNDAFVKNNWHAPTDARYFSFGNNLKVATVDDLLLYLSASDLVIKDFGMQQMHFCIALRPWLNIHPATEFRCIVIKNVLRGITPRDWPSFYAHFEEQAQLIIQTILEFFNSKIRDRFIKYSQNYTFDVIYNSKENPLLLDFGPLNSKTKLYAFTWDEIRPLILSNNTNEVAPVFRFLEKHVGIFAPPAN